MGQKVSSRLGSREFAIIDKHLPALPDGTSGIMAVAYRVQDELKALGIDRSESTIRGILREIKLGRHAGYREWKAGNASQPTQRAQAAPMAMPTEVTVTDRDVERIAADESPAAVTIAVSDTQWGEHEFLLPCWYEWRAMLVERVKATRARSVKLLANGDLITGAGVFRDQESAVVLPNVGPQVLYGAHMMAELVEALPVPARVIMVPGNHDVSKGGVNVSAQLVTTMRLIGLDAVYAGRHALINLAPDSAPSYPLYATHGFGNSAFYPASYALIRAVKDYLVQDGTWKRIEDGAIRRVNTGHTHWLQVGLDLAGVKLDVNGGWTKPDRHGLGGAVRPIGGVLYTHTGNQFLAETVRPTDATIRDAVRSPHTSTDNMAHIAAGLRAMTERMMDLGLTASERML